MDWVRHHDRYEPAAGCCEAGNGVMLPRRAVEGRRPGADVVVTAQTFGHGSRSQGVGALHGLNPATGWMLAAAWGVRCG